ncbi:hypothetical protein DUZ99_03455 [Xylanibacillus composti]|nr:hypothetical protein [Xylanibacillus composti]MDT9724057.1 hypothetical protein [Xylanibacillus composti]
MNTKTVSNLIPVLKVYGDPVTLATIMRCDVLPIEASETASFYGKKFLWDRKMPESIIYVVGRRFLLKEGFCTAE